MLSKFYKAIQLHAGFNGFCVLFRHVFVQIRNQPQSRVISRKGVFLF